MASGWKAFKGLIACKNWKRVAGYWLLFSALCITLPAVVGHYFKILEQSVEHPEAEELPEFSGQLGELWSRGLAKIVALVTPWLLVLVVCTGLSLLGESLTYVPTARKHWSTPELVAILSCLTLIGSTAFLTPALILQSHRAPNWYSTLNLPKILSIVGAGGSAYIPLGLFAPFAWIPMLMLAMTGIGVLAVPPLAAILLMVHARWSGLFLASHLTD